MDTLFFIASKLLWALVRPETLLLLLVAIGFVALLLGRQRTAAWAVGIAVAGFTLIAIFPMGFVLLRPLEARYPADPTPSDVAGIIVLGGGEDRASTAAWGVPAVNDAGDRFLAAIALAQRFPEATLLFTGGSGELLPPAVREAGVAQTIFTSAGVARDRLLLENASRNTAENAAFSRELAGDPVEGAWLLVTSAFHMPRAIETFCAAGWQRLVPWPTDYRTSGFREGIGWDLAGHLDDLNVGLREWIGLVAYRATGRAVAPDGCLETPE